MEEQKIDIHLTEEVAQGVYANVAIITHSHAEFILDFVSMMPGLPKGTVRSRVIMTPQNAKRLMAALNENIQKFEQNHGIINENTREVLPVFGSSGGKA